MGATPAPSSGLDPLPSCDETNPIDRDAVDLESGLDAATNQENEAKGVGSSSEHGRRALDRGWCGFVSVIGFRKVEEAGTLANSTPCRSELPITNVEASLDRRDGGDERVSLLERKLEGEKMKKKNPKKSSKPPRPPKSPCLDAADQKLIRELSELAMMKRARIERMKKKMKNAKSTSSKGNLCALIVTIIFCLVIIWQGAFSRRNSNPDFHGSPETSVRLGGQFISLHVHKNASVNGPSMSSASPNSNSAVNDH